MALHSARLLVTALAFTALAAAETWSGTIVDVMCKAKDLAGHTTKCNLACAKGGYGLVLADGKFVKFDEGGNARALAELKKTTKEKDLKVRITGSMSGETIQVEKIELQ